jgi:hypothetical protein
MWHNDGAVGCIRFQQEENKTMTRFTTLLVVLFALVATGVHAGEKYSEKSHEMNIDGTSTLHDWTAPVGKVKAVADLTISDGELTEVKAMWVQAQVLSIKSEKGEDMDEKIYEALKTEEGHKTITFNLTKVKDIKKSGNSYKIKALGDMTIAGHKKSNVPMLVTAEVQSNGEVVFKGSQRFTMTQYDMETPSAMLGMITAGDDVTVRYTLTVKKSS